CHLHLPAPSSPLFPYTTLFRSMGRFIGGALPFFVAALTMTAVGRAAAGMVDEVRRQFREIPGIMDGTGKPDSARCVDISTRAARSEEHTSELQSRENLVCRLLL